MEGSIVIHNNAGVVLKSLSILMPGFEQVAKWYYPQVIVNSISLSLARKHLHVIYDIQDDNFSYLPKPDVSYHEFRDSYRGLYYMDTTENKVCQGTVINQPTLPEGVTYNHTTLVTTVKGNN